MGCVQSAPRKRGKGAAAADTEEAAAARLLAAQQRDAALKAAAAERDAAALPRRDTAVLKQAGEFDKRHEDALKAPALRTITVVRGKQSSKLLEGFEAKEAEARAVPELVKVDKSDLRTSKLYDKLKEYEENDRRAAAEPKLEKTFVQRQRESSVVGEGELTAITRDNSVIERGGLAGPVAVAPS